jgi:hypothetical protein
MVFDCASALRDTSSMCAISLQDEASDDPQNFARSAEQVRLRVDSQRPLSPESGSSERTPELPLQSTLIAAQQGLAVARLTSRAHAALIHGRPKSTTFQLWRKSVKKKRFLYFISTYVSRQVFEVSVLARAE